MDQKEGFLQSEGDGYYKRNQASLTALDRHLRDPVLQELSRLSLRPTSILEIGCSNGWRLHHMGEMYSARCVGIDPSGSAVADGTRLFPNVTLALGTADSLPFDDATFQLVVFGFCLYLCDPTDLFRIASEADRVLAIEGHMVIYDFWPPFAYRNRYSHRPGLWCHKMDYSKAFSWNPAYVPLAASTAEREGTTSGPNESEGVWILRKSDWSRLPQDPYSCR